MTRTKVVIIVLVAILMALLTSMHFEQLEQQLVIALLTVSKFVEYLWEKK